MQSGQISAAYKDVAILIEVTPHITPNSEVSMSVLIRKEDIGRFVPLGPNVTAPRTNKIEGNTKVLIQNGETLVIGGLFKKEAKDDSSGVPGFMKIPILGWLFKNKMTTDTVTELLIFITPRVLEKTI